MKNCSIIEDLDLETYQDLLQKNREDILTDCFIRNFGLIRKYAHSDNEQFITKFKKKLIPKYVQQLVEYCQSQVVKSRQLFYARRKSSKDNIISYRKNRQSLPELINTSLLNQSNQFLSDQVLQPNTYHQSYPILFNVRPVHQKPLPNHNQVKGLIQKISPSQKFICGPMFLISPKKKLTELLKISKDRQSKSYANIYSDSINFCQNFLLKNTFDSMGSKRQSQQSTEGLIEIFNVKRTLADEKSIEKKMINVLKKRKSSKNLKMKIFTGYMNSKNSSIEKKQKENIQKMALNTFSKQVAQPILKRNIKQLGLKGKLCIPMKHHRVTTSCLFDQPNFSKQNIEKSDQIIDIPSINGRSNILISTQNKFTLPKFS